MTVAPVGARVLMQLEIITNRPSPDILVQKHILQVFLKALIRVE